VLARCQTSSGLGAQRIRTGSDASGARRPRSGSLEPQRFAHYGCWRGARRPTGGERNGFEPGAMQAVPDVHSVEALSINGSRIMGVSAVSDVQRAGCATDSNRERCKRLPDVQVSVPVTDTVIERFHFDWKRRRNVWRHSVPPFSVSGQCAVGWSNEEFTHLCRKGTELCSGKLFRHCCVFGQALRFGRRYRERVRLIPAAERPGGDVGMMFAQWKSGR